MQKMQNKTLKMPLFLVMALVLAAFTAVSTLAQSTEFNIDEVVVNEVKVVEDGAAILDRLTVETGENLFITVKLDGLNDTEDVSIEAEIRGLESGTIDAETSLFDVKQGRTYAKFLTLKIPANARLDQDLTDNLKLRITASSEDSDEKVDVLLTIDRVRHNLLVLDAQAPESVNAGETAVVEVAVRNRGTKIEEDVFVKASIPELGISRQKFIGDLLPLEDFENEDNELSDKAVALLRLEIPAGTVSGDYALKIQVYSSDGVAKGEETAILSVKGKTAAPVQTSGSAVAIDSSAKTVAKEQGVVYKVTVTNLGSSAQTYTAEVSGVDFGTYSANPGILTLAAGQSGEFNIFVSPAATSTLGAHAFSVAVKADGTVAKTLSLSADVTDSSAGNDRLRQNLIVIAVILIAILIILAIIIAVVTGRRREESEERLY
ncbi:MAG: hypothetical protein QT01_C0005G0012 [archaeon GW2011_AR6]|nr:MAG: hypothetical protein QT01_C0005G0012 [archaeon GW2011_AR6]